MQSDQAAHEPQPTTTTPPPAAEAQPEAHHPRAGLSILALTALGVVYGDIGTSPLYALRESLHNLPPTPVNIYGILSLIFWSLVIVVTIKYIIFILRADNNGEGGILSLTALATVIRPLASSPQRWIVLIGVFGAALLYGDGVITPAISVLSAVEGLKVVTPRFAPFVVPLTVAILIGLFVVQSRGTARLGRIFGPIMLVWFVVIGLLGLVSIVQNPAVLAAINPAYAVDFFVTDGWRGYLVLGSVFLAVTGGEALYADMGHVGKRPIRFAWLTLVLPSLLLNYFGQGALLLREPEAVENSFYLMAPSWALYPLIGLATLATIIASQALISGVFSLTMQANNLGFLPRMQIVHTSATEFGQIYVPMINWALMLACVLTVIAFQSSSNLAAAYGVAVTSTMALTSVIFAVVARARWRWPWWQVVLLTGVFLVVDLAFLGANLLKIPQGGWLALVAGVIIFALMVTWKRGNQLVYEHERDLDLSLEALFARLTAERQVRAPGAAVFLSAVPSGVPAALLTNLEYNGTIHEHVLLTTVQIEDVPQVADDQRLTVRPLGHGFYEVIVRFGFMEEPDVPRALAQLNDDQVGFNSAHSPYFVNRTRVIPTDLPGMAPWREQLYTLMRHNAASAVDFYRLPPSRVFEISTSVEV